MSRTIDTNSAIFVVDDDASVRNAVRSLLASVGLQAEVFASTEEFLQAERPAIPSCLVLDIRLPGTNGLEFQEQLTSSGVHIPIIFITAHGDVPRTRRAMKAGAIEFLTKPFQKDELLTAIHQGIEQDRARRRQEMEIESIRARFNTLSPREKDVLKLVVTGQPNKQTAAQLGVTEITVKVHRAQVMRKMYAASLADLVRMADRLESAGAKQSI